MDELIFEAAPQEGTPDNGAEFFIGTVVNWDVSTGATIRLDGQDTASEKRYKTLQNSRPIYAGHRYLICKQSGTYIILGEIGMPTPWSRISDLASTATLADAITKINLILAALRNQGILYPPQT